MQGQKHTNAVGLGANAVHQVTRATAAKVLERQTHQVLVSRGAQISANALRHQSQDVRFKPTQTPSQQGCTQQATQIQVDQIMVDVFAVLKRNQHIVHQRHGQVRRYQGGRCGGQRQEKASQQTPTVGMGKAPQAKQTPSGQRRVLLTVAHGAIVAHRLELQLALRATRLHRARHRFAMGQHFQAVCEGFLQTHGGDVVRQGESPAGDAVRVIDQTQGAHTSMVCVRQLHAGHQRPAAPSRV